MEQCQDEAWDGVCQLESTRYASRALHYMIGEAIEQKHSTLSASVLAGISQLTRMTDEALDASHEKLVSSLRRLRALSKVN